MLGPTFRRAQETPLPTPGNSLNPLRAPETPSIPSYGDIEGQWQPRLFSRSETFGARLLNPCK